MWKWTAAALVVVAGVVVGVGAWAVPSLFRLNRACQAEGFYMAGFEFQMLGLGYELDKGRYGEAVVGLWRLHGQLRRREGLVRVPRFADTRAEMEFYLGLQNPRTGAFQDDRYPYGSWDGPTQNTLRHLDALARKTGEPLRLRYPLRYLDEIATPEKLRAYLNDVSYLGPLGARFPQTSFHFARELLDYAEPGSLVERHGLYRFSPEWKRALLEWFAGFQDAGTGLWGPRARSDGRLLKQDLNNTASIVKAFVDQEGRPRYADLPLRHPGALVATTLGGMEAGPPAVGRPEEWHEWLLATGKSTKMLTRYLWHGMRETERARAERAFERLLRVRSEVLFVEEEGAFRYYPGRGPATLEGTDAMVGLYEELGAFSAERRARLWGRAEVRDVSGLVELDSLPGVNSVRYGEEGVYYPRPTMVLDGWEMAGRARAWLGVTRQSMGNWVSRQELVERLERMGARPVEVARGGAVEAVRRRLEQGGVTVTGYDVLQRPVARVRIQERQ